MFKYGYELVEYCEKEKKCISTVALEEEAKKFFEHFVWCAEQKQYEPCYPSAFWWQSND